MTEIRAATFNLWGVPYSAEQPARARVLGAALAEGRYDIITLQEVWRREDLPVILAGAEAAGLNYAHHFASASIGSGMVTLSRYPIVDAFFVRFRLQGRFDRLMHGYYFCGKGIGLARVETPDGILDVYNTHTIAQYVLTEPADRYKAHRAAQCYEVARCIAWGSAAGNPALVMGDFNTRDDQFAYRVTTELAGLRDAWREMCPDDPGITFSTANPYSETDEHARLDYVFLRDGSSHALAPVRAALAFDTAPANEVPAISDHYGVAVDFEMRSAKKRLSPSAWAKDTGPMLVELAEALNDGVGELKVLRRRYAGRAEVSALGVIPASIVADRLPGPLRWLTPLLVLLYAFAHWFVVRFTLADESAAMTAMRDEVRQQITE